MSTSGETQFNQRLEDSLLEVSYSVLTITKEQEKIQILQTIATAINVQLTLDERDHIPFVAPTDFQLANSQDRLFCYGPSGCGKSRIIFELAKIKLDEKIERIYIINPRQALDTNIQRANLMQLSHQFTCHDVVVWDNFPDGLMKKDIDTGKLALEIISSNRAKNLFIALKPKFLEIYRGVTEDIPDLYAYQVRYDIDQIREIIRLYGTRITQFKEIYANHVAQNITSITKVLWQKEPFPLTIFNYYRELVDKETAREQLLDAISEAQAMLYPTSYYERQFEHLVNSKARRADAEFLYTIKLCYELALDRKASLVEYLQSQIFGSDPPKDTSRNLSSWVYLSGHYISMHDVPRDAIKFNDQIRLKIIDWLTDNFSDVISSREDQLDSMGAFLGRNIQLLMQHDDDDTKNQKDFLSHPIYQYMKSQRRFEVALGQGAGEVFYLLEQPLQEEVLSRIEKDGEFARGLGEILGKSFEDLDCKIRVDILSRRINQSLLFARGLGESLSNNFDKLSKPLQDEIFQISLKENSNYNFQRGLGAGLGRKFRYLEPDVQKRLLDLASKHIALAIGLGYGLAFNFTSSSAPNEFQNDIKLFAKENAEITRGLGMGLGQNYPFLKKMLQSEILRWTEKDPRLEFGFAYQLSFLFTSLTAEHQNLIFNRVEWNSEFAYGSGFGFGVVYTYLPKDIQQRLLLDLAKRNIRFATGLGAGIGNQLQYLTEEREEDLLSNIDNNEGFATGIGFGIGRSFTFLSQELQHKIWRLMQRNYRFAVGLGWGLGFIFSYLHEDLQNKVLEHIQKESGLASGFGWGLGFMFTYLSTDLQQKANLLALQNSQFALGFGVGLGSLFNYLTQDLQQEVWRRAESNGQFAVGLGCELGYLFSYLPAQMQRDILSRSQSNPFIARGLGWGLGHIFAFLSKDRQQDLLQDAQRNPQLLRGLGWGLGRTLAYLSAELQQTIMRMANTNAQFAVGLGEGLGLGFQHLDSQLRQRAIQLCDKNDAIARGLGFGLGHILNYLQPESQQEMWRRAENNVQFAVGLGMGIGEVIRFLPLSSQDEIFAKMEQNVPLSRGLGSGLAYCTHLYLTGNNMSSKVSDYAKKNKEFCRGYGEGLGRIFIYWTESILNDIIIPNATLNTQFAIGLGEGIGQSLLYDIWRSIANEDVNRDTTKSSALNASERNATLERLFAFDGFSYGVGLGLSGIMEFMSEQTRTSILQVLIPKYQNLAFGFGYGVGRTFSSSLKQKLQEEMLELAEKSSEFARGLGQGIGFNFKYLEPMVQQGLLIFMEKSGEFARGLGQGIGDIFPSLNQKLQEEMLELAEKSGEFARGFSQGLSHSLVYLDEASQTKLTGLAKIKDYATSTLRDIEKKDVIAEFARHDNDFPVFLSLLDSRDIVDKRDKGGRQESDLSKESLVDTEILFSGKREKYCICYIDMMNSTQIASTLNDLQLSKYYGTFLNSMATIAKNFGATIIKNAGDCLIYYFPSTSNSNEQNTFKDVIECGITMISAHQAINAKLFEQRLPPLHYRISADYGKVEVARSSSSQSEDLFGSTMNVCAKINSKAPANGMVIGRNLYQVVSAITEKEYNFERIGEYSGFKEAYPVYSITTKQKRNILNPFRRTTETSIFDSNLHKDTDSNLIDH